MSICAMKPKEIINKSNFNKEVTNGIISEIRNSSKNVIITGPRCSGKSIVLCEYEKEQINTGNDAIYIFSGFPILGRNLTKDEKAYRYELYLASRILIYAKTNYREIFDIKLAVSLHEIAVETDHFIDFILYGKRLGDYYNYEFLHGKLLEKTINLVKNQIGIEQLTIILDRYDWTDSSSEEFQDISKIYFKIFDKYIITADDESVYKSKNRREGIQKKGFDIIDVDYGNQADNTKNIVSQDIKYWKKINNNSNSNINYLDIINQIDSVTYNNLIKKCGGDFGLLFDTLRCFYRFSRYTINEPEEQIMNFFDEAIDNRKQYDEKSHVKKLHL